MRASPQPLKGGYSAYEIVTGLKPQGPLAGLFEQRVGTKVVSAESYANELISAMKVIQQQVATAIQEHAEQTMQDRPSTALTPVYVAGDYVLLRRPPPALTTKAERSEGIVVSKRLLPLCEPKVYRVRRVERTRCYLEDADTGLDSGITFPQPVQMNRLVHFDMSERDNPVDSPQDLTLVMRDRNGINHPGRVVAQTITGKVRVTFDEPIPGELKNGLYELADCEYWWTR